MRNRIKKLERTLPAKPNPQGPLTRADIQSLNSMHRVYGEGGCPDWNEIYPTKGDLDWEFEDALERVYGETRTART